MALGFLLDTSALNRAVDGKLDLCALRAQGPLYTTTHQRRELMNAPEPRRTQLLQEFVSYETIDLDSVTVGAQYVTESEFPAAWEFPLLVKDELGRPARASANWTDAFILDVARLRDLVLVTADQRLADAAEKSGLQVLRAP